ncbi:HD domain-containing phosphohydrolase [Devosia chinhatensis]|uniref:Transcriptional regulator n=1 Tax=Devosia chinhatensis TaxID=429727 RepID=A0A0F5FK84_9HYPH|nr:HD domain-containing phosphohydrolase [Devosia chinhatensis]KKB09256.1 transcriptional regulator [Devosia chinhatensis]
MRVVIVEDNSTSLAILTRLIAALPGCEAKGFVNPREALGELKASGADLVVADYQMPDINGVAFTQMLRANADTASIPVIMVTADLDQSLRLEAVAAGATDFLTKPVNPVELRARVGNLLALRRAQNDLADRAKWLEREVQAATQYLLDREEEVIGRLARAIEYRDGETGDHVGRVAEIARLIAVEIGLEPKDIRNIWLAAPLHDVGKIGVPDAILNKPGQLDPDELQIMRSHVTIGKAILDGSPIDLVQTAAEIAGSHHERWDGTGYPRGLRGADIPLSARITAIADVFDALCTARPYKNAWAPIDAHNEILRGSGSHFDPACVAAFDRAWPRVQAIINHNGVHVAA